MTAALSDLARDLYEQLTARTFHVVDTEFSTHEGEHHLISIGIVPVVGGHRTRATEELYRVMNPGVPIDDITTRIHGFTDTDVAKRRPFNHHARAIIERLNEPGAVFVCHNTIDAQVLRRELERLDERAAAGESGISAGLADLPDLPVLDTQRLGYAVRYPGITRSARVSLDKLCDLTGVTRTAKAHDAREDARAAANALIALLRHAADKGGLWTLEDLLDSAGGGTLHAPSGPAHIRSRIRDRTPLPAEHVARHIYPLSDPVKAGGEEAERWLDMAAECAQLRCPYLRDEAVVAAGSNGAVLLRPLMDDLPHMTAPGQAGMLLGAVYELINGRPEDGVPPTMGARPLRWWQLARPLIAASTPCDVSNPDSCCPSCLEGEPCPRDTVALAVAEKVTLGGSGSDRLTAARVSRLLSPLEKAPLNAWRKHHPEVLAYAIWRVANHLLEEGQDERAYTAVDHGIALGLHTVEPRLTELACDRLIANGESDKAFRVADAVLAQRTTDTAYDDLADWVLFTQNALYAQQPTPRKTITHPRRARPHGHTNPRLYS